MTLRTLSTSRSERWRLSLESVAEAGQRSSDLRERELDELALVVDTGGGMLEGASHTLGGAGDDLLRVVDVLGGVREGLARRAQVLEDRLHLDRRIAHRMGCLLDGAGRLGEGPRDPVLDIRILDHAFEGLGEASGHGGLMLDGALQRAAQLAQVMLDALSHRERQLLDDGMQRATLLLGDEIGGARGGLLDPLQTAIEALAQFVRELRQLTAESVEALLLRLARDLRQLAGRDRAEGLLDDVVQGVTACFEGALDQSACEGGDQGAEKAPGGRAQGEAQLGRHPRRLGGPREHLLGRASEARDQADDGGEYANAEKETGKHGQQASSWPEGKQRALVQNVDQPDRRAVDPLGEDGCLPTAFEFLEGRGDR